MLRQDDYMKSQLVTVGYNFGKEYGGHLAACMVMGCLANRVRLGWGGWLEVVGNVSKYAAEEIPPFNLPSIWDANFVRLLTEVENIYDGSGKDYSCGALYWCDSRRVTRPWFLENIIRSGNHLVTTNMNSLTFYR